MIRKITAIIASLVCAAVIVSFVPEFSSEVAAHASQPVDQGGSSPPPLICVSSIRANDCRHPQYRGAGYSQRLPRRKDRLHAKLAQLRAVLLA